MSYLIKLLRLCRKASANKVWFYCTPTLESRDSVYKNVSHANVILPLHGMYELKRRKIAEEEQADK